MSGIQRKKSQRKPTSGGRARLFPLLVVVFLLLSACGASDATTPAASPVWEEVAKADAETEGALPEEAPDDPVFTTGVADFPDKEETDAVNPEDTAAGAGETSAGAGDTSAYADEPSDDIKDPAAGTNDTSSGTNDAQSDSGDAQSDPAASDSAAEELSTEPALPDGSPASDTAATTPVTASRTIVIDPGHQTKANTGTEPLGPGSSEMKTKVSGGTRGVATGVPEYQLVLTIGLALKAELQSRGYTVVMTRESNDVNISNAERAAIANNLGAAALVRLHADGSENASTRGCMTICQTASNPYNASLHGASYALSSAILSAYASATGAKANRIWETDTMTGINWAQVPCTILEMGYMTNAEEDVLMQDASYQAKMVQGIANGIDAFINR